MTTPPGELMYMYTSFLGFSDSKKEQLRGDERSRLILDAADDEHDPFAQQPRINVEAAFATARLFDDDGDEAADNVGMIWRAHEWSLFCPEAYVGGRARGFKPCW